MQLIERVGVWTWGLMFSVLAISLVTLPRRIRRLGRLSMIHESVVLELRAAKALLQRDLRRTVVFVGAAICHGVLWCLCPPYPDWWRTAIAPLLLLIGGMAGCMALILLTCALALTVLSVLGTGVSSALAGVVRWIAQRLFGVQVSQETALECGWSRRRR